MSVLSAGAVVAAVARFEVLLAEHRDRLDEMNVYPVPDGDTGTNLLGTVAALRKVLGDGAVDADLGEVASAIGRAAVRAARGNSGIIVAESLSGFTAALAAGGPGTGVAAALAEASRAAWRAVSEPAEGTVLTVAADAARVAGGRAAERPADDLAVARAADDEAWASLARTPELLPALAEAGVVDAGGAGYALWLDALVAALGGNPPARVLQPPGPVGAVRARAGTDGSVGPRFELVVDLLAADDDVDRLRRAWAGSGDSIVVAGHAGRWRAHVHTDDPAGALATAESVGDVADSEVTDLHDQAARHRQAGGRAPRRGEHVPTGVVAVAASEQLTHLFSELGATAIVPGGRGNRPPGAAIIDAIDRADADGVVVLPNDGPTVEVARRAGQEARYPAVVVPTASMVEGLVALCALPRAGESPAAVSAAMAERLARTWWSEILPVARPAHVDGVDVDVGDWLVRGHRPRFTLAELDCLSAAVLAVDRLVEAVDGGTGDLLEAVVVARGALGEPADSVALRAHVESLYPAALVETYDTAEPNIAFALAARRR